MLSSLQIKNFAIINNLEIDFEENLTVITGETGSGKSIIIQALDICFGKKVEAHMFLDANQPCEIICQFDLTPDSTINNWLKEQELYDNQPQIIIRRIMHQGGRAKNYINGTLTNLQTIKGLASLLVNIHGQHENQALLKPDTQLKLLDSFANNKNLVSELNDLYHKWQQTTSKINAFKTQKIDASQKKLLSYQISELEETALSQEELIALENKYKLLENSSNILYECQKAAMWLSNETDGIQERLYKIHYALENFTDLSNNLKQTNECINQAQIQTQEALNEINNYLHSVDPDPLALQQIETQLEKIYDLARKFKITPELLLDHKKELELKLKSIDASKEILEELIKEKEKTEKNYFSLAKNLTQKRKSAAKNIDQEVTSHIKALNICGPFKTQITSAKPIVPKQNGLDEVSFYIKTNPNSPALPINKIASGGELSRISLALQAITADQFSIPTLIFDEVDTGINGATAEIVGKLLKTISKSAQILCITHLPQVASQSTHHLVVSQDKSKHTIITKLTPKEKIQEIARMLAGTKISKKTLQHAEEMLS